jgi:hypothetical protein
MASLTCPKISPAVYKPRRPEKTVFFQVVKKYYTTWPKNLKKPIVRFHFMYIENSKAILSVAF